MNPTYPNDYGHGNEAVGARSAAILSTIAFADPELPNWEQAVVSRQTPLLRHRIDAEPELDPEWLKRTKALHAAQERRA